ncbi:MAG: 2-amino-4-hydroxy-6-hydroxymethyldihydropteridine diphosphokinase [Pseudomonadota bacterium]
MTAVYFGLGSNVDPERNLKLGLQELERRFGPLVLSPTYLGAAVGFDGDDFLNLVAGCQSDLSPQAIVDHIEEIHIVAGRERSTEKFNSRKLDIDLLLYGECVSEGPPTQLPRKDVLDFAFVLRPMVDIVPDLRHPETGRTLADHWSEFDKASQPLTEVSLDIPAWPEHRVQKRRPTE